MLGAQSVKHHFRKRDFSPKYVRSQMIKKLQNQMKPINQDVTNLSSKLFVDLENTNQAASKVEIIDDNSSMEHNTSISKQMFRRSPNSELSYFINLKY